MTNTTHFSLPKPDTAASVADEFYRLINTLDQIDAILKQIADAVTAKAAANHTHAMADIPGLVAALSSKMEATRTFALGELRDVSGAADAASGYILAKTALGFAFQSAAALLGSHQHSVADIVGLAASIDAKIAALVASAPATLDTLSELAAALGNNPNFATTVASQIGSLTDTIHQLTSRVEGAELSVTTHTNGIAAVESRLSAQESKNWISLPSVTATGEAIDWTSVPAGVDEIELWLEGVSFTNGAPNMLVQLGTGGVLQTSGYRSGSAEAGSGSRITSVGGLIIQCDNGGRTFTGMMRLQRFAGNLWRSYHAFGEIGIGYSPVGGGAVTLSGELNVLRFRPNGNSPIAFDSGSVQLRYRR